MKPTNVTHKDIGTNMTYIVYHLQPFEYERYRNHLLALDANSRYLRFGYAISDEAIHRLCDRIESESNKHQIFVIEDKDMKVLAAGHVSVAGTETELAFSVLKQHQGQGMGSALMKRCIAWCQNRGIRHGNMVCLATNTAVKKLASRHGVLVNDHGEVTADLAIPNTDVASIYTEFVETNLANIDHMGKLHRKFTKMISLPLLFN